MSTEATRLREKLEQVKGDYKEERLAHLRTIERLNGLQDEVSRLRAERRSWDGK